MLEKDRDGCPKVINIGSSKTYKYFEFNYKIISKEISIKLDNIKKLKNLKMYLFK